MILDDKNLGKTCSAKESFGSLNTFSNYMQKFLRLSAIESDFNNITNTFMESIIESLKISTNTMLPFLSVESLQTKNTNIPECKTCLYIVIELGGSTLRIGILRIKPGFTIECIESASWDIENGNKHLDSFFIKWIAERLIAIIPENMYSDLIAENNKIKLGITWSFPIIQSSCRSGGILSHMGKGFTISNEFKGKDIKDIFEINFRKFGIPVEVYAIINDSIAVYLTGTFLNDSSLSLIQGTGVNSCFEIETKNLDKRMQDRLLSLLNRLDFLPGSKLLINTEASFLGYHLSKYVNSTDIGMFQQWEKLQKDDASFPKPHIAIPANQIFQPLEILTSGRYIPEITRRIAVKEFDNKLGMKIFDRLEEYSLTSKLLSSLYSCENIESFYIHFNEITKSKLSYNSMMLSMIMKRLKIIIEKVIYRASLILSSYIISLLKVEMQINNVSLPEREIQQTTTISVTGSMLQYFPGYKDTVLKLLMEYKEKTQDIPTVKFKFVNDCNLYGAAIAAHHIYCLKPFHFNQERFS